MEERFFNSGRNCAALLSTAVIGILIVGTNKLGGQFFIACMDFFDVGRKEASFPFTLLPILRSTSGPLTGYLGRKYGTKAVTELGSLLCVVGIGGCFFAKNITTVSILWGVLYGFGSGLGSLLIPHILRDFFVKHYDKAHGYYTAGAGIGGFLLPMLSDVLLNQYGLPGTFLILSALMLNFIVASLILRSLKRGPHMYDNLVDDIKRDRKLQRVETDNGSPSKLKPTGLELVDIVSDGTERGMCENAKRDKVKPYKSEFFAKTILLDVTKLSTSEELSPPDTKRKSNSCMTEKNGDVNQDSTEHQTKETQ